MRPALYALMLEWLDSGDDTQRRHARFRLSQPDAESYEKPPGFVPVAPEPSPKPPPEPRPLPETIRLLSLMHACPDREKRTDCGCAGLAKCARGNGREGLVSHHDCLECLRGQ